MHNPVPYLTVVGPCPRFNPLTPYCLKIFTAASNDPLYILSAWPL